jgi:glycosyltransferase involved in cell wall biosynthesis
MTPPIQIVAAYATANEATTIAESIRSLKAYVDRFVVIDSIFVSNTFHPDATHSTDDTRAIVEALCAAPPAKPLTYVASAARLTQAYARNAYLELINPPDWVFVVDGDEVFYGDHQKILAAFDAIRNSSNSPSSPISLEIPVYTTAVNVHKQAPDVTESEFALNPLISTWGYMPRLFAANPRLRYLAPPGASTPVLTFIPLNGPAYHLASAPDAYSPPGDMFLINHHTRQTLQAYQNDYEWETKGVIQP